MLYHDNHLLALNKPPGLLTQPSGTGLDNLEDRAKEFVRQVKGKPGNVFLHAVHRLDRVVSGVVLFACTDKALSRLNADVRARRVGKIYHAVCGGSLPAQQGTLRHFLVHGEHRAEIARDGDFGAKESRLDYRLLRSGAWGMLVEVRLHTGRYHQIRAQLAACGCPILGDSKYGSPISLPGGNIALHHTSLSLVHPVRKEEMVLNAPYPCGWPLPA